MGGNIASVERVVALLRMHGVLMIVLALTYIAAPTIVASLSVGGSRSLAVAGSRAFTAIAYSSMLEALLYSLLPALWSLVAAVVVLRSGEAVPRGALAALVAASVLGMAMPIALYVSSTPLAMSLVNRFASRYPVLNLSASTTYAAVREFQSAISAVSAYIATPAVISAAALIMVATLFGRLWRQSIARVRTVSGLCIALGLLLFVSVVVSLASPLYRGLFTLPALVLMFAIGVFEAWVKGSRL